jgi:hypothetical protein
MWLRDAIEVVYTTNDVWVGVKYVALTVAVLVVGLIAVYALVWGLEWWFLRRKWFNKLVAVRRVQNTGNLEYVTQRSHVGKNICHLVLRILFFSGIIMIVWIACASAGFNPWTTAAATLGLSIIMQQMFGTPMSLTGSSFSILLTNNAELGQYYEFLGMPEYDGRVIDVDSMQVTLERMDKMGSGELVYISTSTFLMTPKKRNMHREHNEPSIFEDISVLMPSPSTKKGY